MIFNSFNFIIIYPLLFLLYYIIPQRLVTYRNLYLLALSYLLYINFNAAYSLILLGITVITYISARVIEGRKAAGEAVRKLPINSPVTFS